MDAISDERIEEVVIMSCAQAGKTEMILNLIGYHVAQDPSPMLVVQPTLEMAQTFSKDRLAPMVRDCSSLSGKIKDPRARDSGNQHFEETVSGRSYYNVRCEQPVKSGIASNPHCAVR